MFVCKLILVLSVDSLLSTTVIGYYSVVIGYNFGGNRILSLPRLCKPMHCCSPTCPAAAAPQGLHTYPGYSFFTPPKQHKQLLHQIWITREKKSKQCNYFTMKELCCCKTEGSIYIFIFTATAVNPQCAIWPFSLI